VLINILKKAKKGLRKGKLADLVILDKNPLKVAPDSIKTFK
jgi:predicted amidohydrolase YtcJ